jgi:hypothetical protein
MLNQGMLRDRLSMCAYPQRVYQRVLKLFEYYPKVLEKHIRKAHTNSRRHGIIGGGAKNLWIAANLAEIEAMQRHICHYCGLYLGNLEPRKIIFEHFQPKLQSPGNIVFACDWCDKFKKNRSPLLFRAMLFNETLIAQDPFAHSKLDKLKLRQFAPLVARHLNVRKNQVWLRFVWLKKMVDLAREFYHENLLLNAPDERYLPSYIQARYTHLYRQQWLPPEIR